MSRGRATDEQERCAHLIDYGSGETPKRCELVADHDGAHATFLSKGTE